MKMCIIYTPAEIAEKLKVHINLVYELISQGKLKAKRVGRLHRITKENLEAFMENEEEK